MKNVLLFGLLAAAALTLMVTATASATVITNGGKTYTGTFSASGSTSITIHGSLDATCTTSTIEGAIQNHGESEKHTIPASGPINTFSLSGCDHHVSVKNRGSFWTNSIASGKGTLFSSGLTISVEYTVIFGNVNCNYLTNSSDIGTVDSYIHRLPLNPDIPAFITLQGAIPIEAAGSSGLCSSLAEVTGTYRINTPTDLWID